MLEFVEVAVGEGDPLGCALCTPQAAPGYLPAGDLIARIRYAAAEWVTGPGPNVVLGGPEPFAHPELPALVVACVDAGMQRIALETDGAALSVPANVLGVLRSGVRHLRVRVLDAEATHGDVLGGRAGRTRDALAGVRAFLAAAGEAGLTVVVTAVIPVCRHNADALPATIAELASLGVQAVRLVPSADATTPAPALLAAACDTGMVNRLWVEVDPGLPLPDTHALHAVPGEVRGG